MSEEAKDEDKPTKARVRVVRLVDEGYERKHEEVKEDGYDQAALQNPFGPGKQPEFVPNVLPVDAPRNQRVESRRAFYAGATGLMTAIMGKMDPGAEPTASDLKLMDTIDAEIKAFYRDVERGRA